MLTINLTEASVTEYLSIFSLSCLTPLLRKKVYSTEVSIMKVIDLADRKIYVKFSFLLTCIHMFP